MINSIIQGNSIEILKTLSEESIDIIITDPPYGINYKSNMQKYDNRTGSPVKKDREEYFETISGQLPLD